jgi:DNA-binding PadR family transcriptional regulator
MDLIRGASMDIPIRMTYATAAVLRALEIGYRYGFDIADVTGLRRGSVYPVLRRLEKAGLVSAEWEDSRIAHDSGRPPRRYYRLRSVAAEILEEAKSRFPVVVDGFVPLRGKNPS